MTRSHSLIAVLTLLTLTACSTPNAPTTATSPAALPASTVTSPETAMSPAASTDARLHSKAAIASLKTQLTMAIDAVKMGDFAKAKQHYGEFHSGWKGSIEKSVEKHSKANYAKFEQGEEGIEKNLINAAAPNKEKAISALQMQIQVLDTYTSSLQ